MTASVTPAPGTQPVRRTSESAETGTPKALLDTARAELNYREGPNNYNKYSPHLGMQNVPWCAAFVSRMMVQSGVGKEILKGTQGSASVSELKSRCLKAGLLRHANETPQPGDLIFLRPSHVGIVEKVENGRIYTIEGNTSDRVDRRSYAIGNGRITGFGRVFQDGVTNEDAGAPDNVASLAKQGYSSDYGRDVRTAGSRPTTGRVYPDHFLLKLQLLVDLLGSADTNSQQLIAAVRALLPKGVSDELIARVVDELKRKPSELVLLIQSDPQVLLELDSDEMLNEMIRQARAEAAIDKFDAASRVPATGVVIKAV